MSIDEQETLKQCAISEKGTHLFLWEVASNEAKSRVAQWVPDTNVVEERLKPQLNSDNEPEQ